MRLPRDRFPIQRVIRAEGVNRGRALRITCGCGCGATEDFIITTDKQPPPEAAVKYFERKGWHVGKRSQHDRSPACVAAEEERRKAEREEQRGRQLAMENKIAQKINEAAAVAAHEKPMLDELAGDGSPRLEAVHADPPRTMTRPDRRRIFDAIDADYPEPERGYCNGVTDEILAVRLNVPRAWVSRVREESFGPELVVDWTAVDHKREAVRKMIKDAEETFLEALAAAEKAANDLDREIATLKKRVGLC